MALERLNPRDAATPSGPYVNAVRAGKLVFVSGQVAYGPDGGIVGVGDVEAQATQVMENLGTCLREAGARFEDVTKVTVFLVDMAHRGQVATVRERYFKGNNPASTLVQVAGLVHPDLLLEVEAIAVLPD